MLIISKGNHFWHEVHRNQFGNKAIHRPFGPGLLPSRLLKKKLWPGEFLDKSPPAGQQETEFFNKKVDSENKV